MLELGLQLRHRILQLHSFEIVVAHIKADEVGLFIQGEEQRLLPLVNAHGKGLHIHGVGLTLAHHAKADGNTQVKQAAGAAGVTVLGLGLGHRDLGQLAVAIPAVGHLVVGVAAAQHVLIKQGAEVAASGLVDRPQQVDGFYGLVSVVLHKGVDCPPKQGIPQLGANHVVDAGTLFVNVAIVEFDRLPVDVGDHGAAVAAFVFAQVAAGLAQAVVGGVIGTVFLGRPHHFGVGGHALFYPGVAPVVDHQQIAKPLVGQLVDDEGF